MVVRDVDNSLSHSSSGAIICTKYMSTKETPSECHTCSNSNSNDEVNDSTDNVVISPSELIENLSSEENSIVDDEDYFAQFIVPDESDYESDSSNADIFISEHLNRKQLHLVDQYEGENYQRTKRSNKKMHARRQIKIKQAKSIKYKSHNEHLYIHHRLAKIVKLDPPSDHYLGSKVSTNFCSREQLTSPPTNHRDLQTEPHKKVAPNHQQSIPQNNVVNVNHQFQQYTINENNVYQDPTFDDAMVAFLLDMQNRDLSPDDYEMLLRLDERVQRKTVDQNILDTLPTITVHDSHLNEQCTICIETYTLGQQLKSLPCGHIFHLQCIETYLKEFSVQCPLDNLPLV